MKNTCLLYLSVLVCQAWTLHDCPHGWFGEGCAYQCHCGSNSDCSNDGVCLNNAGCYRSSSVAYFGPGCQYEDLAVAGIASISDLSLNDHDDTSCLDSGSSVQLTFKEPTFFLWIRVVLNVRTNIPVTYEFTLNKDDNCSNMRTYNVDTFIVDVQCDNTVKVRSVRVRGTVVPHLCSLYVSGGRNVALKQTAAQSSLYVDDDGTIGNAEKAVDGNPHLLYMANRSCTHTQYDWLRNGGSWWRLRYSRPQILRKIIVWNRINYQERLQGFVLTTYSVVNQSIEVHRAASTPAQKYVFYHASDVPILWLTIHLPHDGLLTLCEVITMGDTWCPQGDYSLWCEHNCKCSADQSCHLATGSCGSGCPLNRYGIKCSRLCSRGCSGQLCLERSGDCLECNSGFMGPQCDKVCNVGTYGVYCQNKCSVGCFNKTCHHVTGDCTCRPKYMGARCDVCMSGYYGANCSFRCVQQCFNRLCDFTGKCLSCGGNKAGTHCESCQPKWYSEDCSMPCRSENCEGSVCERSTGRCTACPLGKYGEMCGIPCPEECNGPCNITNGYCFSCRNGRRLPLCKNESEKNFEGLYFLAVFLLIPVVLFFCCKRRRRKKMPQPEKARMSSLQDIRPDNTTPDDDDDISSLDYELDSNLS